IDHGVSDVSLRNRSFHLFDATDGTLLRSFNGIEEPVDLCFSPDGRLLAACGVEGLRVWETATGTLRAHLRGLRGMTTAVAFAPDGGTLLSTGLDGTVLAWHLATVLKQETADPLPETPLPELWDRLASADAAEAWTAMRALLARPAAVGLLREKLHP